MCIMQLLGEVFYKCQIRYSIYSAFPLNYILTDFSTEITVRGVLKSTTLIVVLSISCSLPVFASQILMLWFVVCLFVVFLENLPFYYYLMPLLHVLLIFDSLP